MSTIITAPALIGTICAPESGTYYFWIAADDNCELWLSSDENESNEAQIAGHTGWTSSKEWNKYSTQKSAGISLTAGNKYFIEAIMKEAGGGDNLAVGWRKPSDGNGTSPAGVIPGSALSEYTGVTGDNAFQQDGGTDGLVVMEAENYHNNVSQGGKDFVAVTSPSSYSGDGGMQSLPKTGTYNNTGYETNSPRLDFEVNFVKTGTHYVWIRGASNGSSTDDSFHSGLDGSGSTSSDRIQLSNSTSDWTWRNNTMDSEPATINVPSTGLHTFNIWMREDGARIDKIVLTTNSGYTPSGSGPGETKSAKKLTGIKDDLSDKISIYPNPADDGILTIMLPEGQHSISIYTLHGVKQDVLTDQTSITELNISDYSAGVSLLNSLTKR
jgi:hypothetical protein